MADDNRDSHDEQAEKSFSIHRTEDSTLVLTPNNDPENETRLVTMPRELLFEES